MLSFSTMHIIASLNASLKLLLFKGIRKMNTYRISSVILQTNENLKDCSIVKNGSSDALSLINHNEAKNSNMDGWTSANRVATCV